MKRILSGLLIVVAIIFAVQTSSNAQLKFAGLSVSGVYTFNQIGTVGFPDFPIEGINFNPDNSINFDMNLFSTYNLYKGIFGGLELGYYQAELVYLGVEHTTVIQNKEAVDAAIRHNISAYFKWFYPSIFFGYTYKTFSLCLGNRFNFNISGNYYHTQTIIAPDSMFFINPDNDLNADIGKVNSPVYMPFLRLTYDFGKDLFTSSSFDAQIDFEYSMALNNIIDEYYIKTSNIKLGINLGFDLLSKHKDLVIIRDTVYKRDTIVSYSYNVKNDTINLNSSMSSTTKSRESDVVHYTTTITEHYSREIPRPHSLLNGELRTVFIARDGKELKECIISYSKIKESLSIPGYENGELKYSVKSRMKESIEIPNIRFYTSFIAEAGLDSMIINLFADKRLIEHIVSNDDNANYIDIAIDTIMDVKTSKSLRYELILVDLEGQKKKVADGKILFKNKITNTVSTKDIYFIDLAFDNTTIEKIFKNIDKKAKNKKTICYYPAQLNRVTSDKVKKLTSLHTNILFTAKEKNNLINEFKYGDKNKDYLYIVVIR